jgi:tetratricopeptide (TPR) repeat protein
MARKQNLRRPATHDDDRRRNASGAVKRDGPPRPAHGFWTSERLCLLTVCGLLTLAVALTFAQTAGFAFINLDDGDYVFGNPKVSGGLSWDGIGWAFTKSHMENWHPLTWISLMLDCNLYGLNPAGHHLTNVVLQAAVAVLLFLVLRAMTGRLWPSALVAALFAIHPLRAESVAWVTERKDVLSGLFFVLCLGAYTSYARRPFSFARYSAVLLFAALGLLSKAIVVTLPFLLLLLDYWPLGRFAGIKPRSSIAPSPARSPIAASPARSPIAAFWRLVAEKLPLLLLSVLAMGLTVWAQHAAIEAGRQYGFWWRVRYVPIAYVTYLAQFFWPAGLAGLYPRPSFDVPLWQTCGAVALLAGISAAALIWRRRRPYLAVGWLWFLGMSVPVIGIVQLGTAAVADRNTYLTQIGLAIAIVWGAADACRGARMRAEGRERNGNGDRHLLCEAPGGPFRQKVPVPVSFRGGRRKAVHPLSFILHPLPAAALAAAIGLAILSATAWRQTRFWQDSETFWNRALACTSNNVVAHTNLGVYYGVNHRPAEAAAQLQKALAIDPNSMEALFSLGSAYFSLGQLDKAETYYRRAIAVDPNLMQARGQLGRVLAGQGKWEAAIAQYRQLLEDSPDMLQARFDLVTTQLARGDIGEAIAEWKAILRLKPDNLDALCGLAEVLATCPDPRFRDGPAALDFARQADRLSGGQSPEVLRSLSAAQAETGHFRQAADTARWALELAAQQGKEPLAASLKSDVARFQAGLPRRGPK